MLASAECPVCGDYHQTWEPHKQTREYREFVRLQTSTFIQIVQQACRTLKCHHEGHRTLIRGSHRYGAVPRFSQEERTFCQMTMGGSPPSDDCDGIYVYVDRYPLVVRSVKRYLRNQGRDAEIEPLASQVVPFLKRARLYEQSGRADSYRY